MHYVLLMLGVDTAGRLKAETIVSPNDRDAIDQAASVDYRGDRELYRRGKLIWRADGERSAPAMRRAVAS